MSYPEGLVTVAEDPKWQRASSLITTAESVIGLIDIPAHKLSISQTNAHLTPKAIREALRRFSTHSYTADKNIAVQSIQDLGEIADPEQNEQQTIEHPQRRKQRAGYRTRWRQLDHLRGPPLGVYGQRAFDRGANYPRCPPRPKRRQLKRQPSEATDRGRAKPKTNSSDRDQRLFQFP